MYGFTRQTPVTNAVAHRSNFRTIRGKQIKGRKRHILVDTLGLVLLVVVTAAHVQDRAGAQQLLAGLATQFRRLRLLWADGAYEGPLEDWVRGLRKWRKLRLEIVRKPPGQKGFAVLPWRWIVERTFAWISRQRRLRTTARDHGRADSYCDDPADGASARRLKTLFKLALRGHLGFLATMK